MASVLIVQALQKGPCGANQIAYTDLGSADKLSEQGLDLRNTANKTLPFWLLLKLIAHALKAFSRPDAILIIPSIVCSSRVITCNSNFQQLAKDNHYTDKPLADLNLDYHKIRVVQFDFLGARLIKFEKVLEPSNCSSSLMCVQFRKWRNLLVSVVILVEHDYIVLIIICYI